MNGNLSDNMGKVAILGEEIKGVETNIISIVAINLRNIDSICRANTPIRTPRSSVC